MTRTAYALFFTFLPFLTFAGENPSALKALKAVPKEEVKKLARIEAQGGTPVPERWHFLVHSPESASGLKEYVVASGELVSAREISQFAESLTEDDIIGDNALKVDSDKLVALAKKYAAANEAPVATINYQLIRIGEEAQPIWRVNCLDEAGSVSGTLVVTASKGTVVSHEGFAVEPEDTAKGKKRKSALRFETESAELVAVIGESTAEEADELGGPDQEQVPVAAVTEEKPSPAAAPASKVSAQKKVASKSSRTSSRREIRRRGARVPKPVAVARRVTSPVRHIVRRILPF